MDILFCEGSKKEVFTLTDEVVKDLALDEIVNDIAVREEERLIIKKVLSEIPQDMADIEYRREIMSDLLGSEVLTTKMDEALDQIRVLNNYKSNTIMHENSEVTVYSLLQDMRELGVYVGLVEKISGCLEDMDISSRGLIELRDKLQSITREKDFAEAKKDVEKLIEELSNVRSLMVGINLTPDLNIREIVDVEFNDYYFKPRLSFVEMAAGMFFIQASGTSNGGAKLPINPFDNIRDPDQLLAQLAPIMNKRLKKYFGLLKRTLSRHINVDGYFVTELLEGLTFYVSMAKYARRIEELGHSICMPQMRSDLGFELKDFYNIRLVIRGEKNIVLNDFDFTSKERLFILTGPNRGGKTILEQGIGIAALMAASGTFVTAKECEGIPFHKILTHFPQDENLTINYGRLGEEAIRVREIANLVDDNTLVLFNETYCTTSADDGLYLSKDLMHLLKDKGAYTIFNTHIHALAGDIDEMNQWDGESEVISIIMEIVDEQNTFKVKKSTPDRNSHAKNVALKYGITYEQMI